MGTGIGGPVALDNTILRGFNAGVIGGGAAPALELMEPAVRGR